MTARLQQVDVVVAQGQGIADATRQPPATAISGASRRRAPRGRSCSRSTRISRSSSASAFFPTKTRAISRASPTPWPRRDCRRALHPRSRRGITFRMRSKKNHGALLSSCRSSDRKRSRPNPHDGQRPSTLAEDPAEPSPELRISAAAAQTRVVSIAGIRLGPWESARAFKGIVCDDISEFESYMPSHAVQSPPAQMWRSGSMPSCPASGRPSYLAAMDSPVATRRLGCAL
jgi:hypothetical protein